MKRIILLSFFLMLGCSSTVEDHFVECGYLAKCPETHDSKWISGQCISCDIKESGNITYNIPPIIDMRCHFWGSFGIELTDEEMAELNYTGKHKLVAKTNSCGLVKIYYTISTNKTHTYIYDNGINLLGEYISDSCLNITETYNNVTFECYKVDKEVVFMVIE